MTTFDYKTSQDKDALIEYAISLGLDVNARFGIESIIAKIDEHLAKEQAPEAEEEPVKRRKLTIHKTENDTGSNQVALSVNGKTWLIQRGEEVEVPDFIVEVLRNAIKEVHEYNSKTDETVRREVPSYPFSVTD